MDEQATTRMDPRVLDAMLPYFLEEYGNPHSRTHSYGWKAEEATEKARQSVADLINASQEEVIFTSGATESNNIAIKGVARFYKSPEKNHIITTVIEHKCVIESCRSLEMEGFRVTYLGVDCNGIIDLQELESAMTPDTILVSIMTVNNEIGAIQPMAEIGEICRRKEVFFHTDAAQAFGKIPLDVRSMKIDLMSISGHKIYGPKGIGALYVSKKPRVRLRPLLSGGGQERGIRSGTLPTPLIVGLGTASDLASREMHDNYHKVKHLAKMLLDQILQIPEVYLNGSMDESRHYFGCINISFAFIEGESMICALNPIAVSSGSACTSSSLEQSYVIHALGKDPDLAHTSIRFGIGKYTTEEDIQMLIEKIQSAVCRLRELSPLWEMFQEGIDLKSIVWGGHH